MGSMLGGGAAGAQGGGDFSIGGMLGLPPDLRERLALSANSASMSPDPGFAQSIESQRSERMKAGQRNQTAEYIAKLGRPDLAELVASGGIDASQALSIAMKGEEPPQLFSMNGKVVSVNPRTGETKVLYEGDKVGSDEIKQDSKGNWFKVNQAAGTVERIPVQGEPPVDPNAPPELDAKDQLTAGSALRQDVIGLTKTFEGVKKAATDIETYYKAPRNPGTDKYGSSGSIADYALTVAFVKLLDPTSVAREGEVDMVSKAASVPASLKAYLEQAYQGSGQLPQPVRDEIMRLTSQIYNKERQNAQKTIGEYRSAGENAGVAPDLVWPGGNNIRRMPENQNMNPDGTSGARALPPLPPGALPLTPDQQRELMERARRATPPAAGVPRG